jgi:hypothetical protein
MPAFEDDDLVFGEALVKTTARGYLKLGLALVDGHVHFDLVIEDQRRGSIWLALDEAQRLVGILENLVGIEAPVED